MLAVLMLLLGVALVAAGFWWLWAGRWTPMARVQQGCSQPTRMVIGLVHLVLGYHVAVWSLPVERKAIQIPRQHWPWVVLGATVAVAGSRWMDQFDQSTGDDGQP